MKTLFLNIGMMSLASRNGVHVVASTTEESIALLFLTDRVDRSRHRERRPATSGESGEHLDLERCERIAAAAAQLRIVSNLPSGRRSFSVRNVSSFAE